MKESMLTEQDALIFCYDVTNQESFYSLSKLFQMNMQMEYMTSKKRPVILVGCKCDESETRQVEFQDGERTADGFQAPYIECSAKSNH